MNILIDLPEPILDHIENVRKVFNLTSRRAAITHILRRDMVTSPCDELISKIEALKGGGVPLAKEQWPVVVENILCPKCDPKLNIMTHCGGTDQTFADTDNYKRGIGNERMIRWICVCPQCKPKEER